MFTKTISGFCLEIKNAGRMSLHDKAVKTARKDLLSVPSRLEIAEIEDLEALNQIKTSVKNAVIYIYYHYTFMTFNTVETEDPNVVGDRKMSMLMDFLGPEVSYYKMNMSKLRHYNTASLLDLHSNTAYPAYYIQLEESSKKTKEDLKKILDTTEN